MQRKNMQGQIREIWVMLEWTWFTANVAADETLQEGCKSRENVVDELCAGRIHHLKKPIVTIASGTHFRSVGDLLVRRRGRVGFLQRRKCFHFAQPTWSMNFIHKAADSMCKCWFFCSLSLFWEKQKTFFLTLVFVKNNKVLWKTLYHFWHWNTATRLDRETTTGTWLNYYNQSC